MSLPTRRHCNHHLGRTLMCVKGAMGPQELAFAEPLTESSDRRNFWWGFVSHGAIFRGNFSDFPALVCADRACTVLYGKKPISTICMMCTISDPAK